jgi:glycine cleavage system aminomethyltransferase T
MSAVDEALGVRTSVTLADGAHIAAVRVGGRDAQDLVDRVSPRPLFARQGQMLHTLLLADDATPIADLYIGCDEDDYVLVAEGMTSEALATYLRAHADGLDAKVIELADTHAFMCVDGPYAWELLAEATSPDVIGLGYMSFYDAGTFTCFRGGKTGEYGYDLLVEKARLAEVRELLLSKGRPLGIREVGLPALEVCQLEAGFFNIRRDVRPGLTPIELQLQWRTSRDRDYPGAKALQARRADVRRRVVLAASEQLLPIDADVVATGETVGTVLNSGPSPTRGGYLALALIDLPLAHAGLSGFSCNGIPVATVSAPAVNNRSLYVDPQRHAWATREKVPFPPLVRPAWS